MLELPEKAMEAVKVFGFGFERERGYVDCSNNATDGEREWSGL